MPLETGKRVGVYEVTGELGAGAMGEVYRAHDSTLGRDVALKVLPDSFIADPDRLGRFQREAKVLASLNHPNIGGIYGLETSGDNQALVLELIDGPTLADRIADGPVPVDQAIAMVRQIAGALSAAHDAGVVHRDLKPANIKVRSDGTIKVLDFGLAKATEGGATGSESSDAATMTAMTSQPGAIIGTAAYMSPEQARGEPVTKQADIWALGCVCYELLTGRRAFDGRTMSDTLASVLARESDMTLLPDDTPSALVKFITRCLEKEPTTRLRDSAEGMRQLDEQLAEPDADSHTPTSSGVAVHFLQRPVTMLASIMLAVVVGAGAVWALSSPAPVASVTRFEIPVQGFWNAPPHQPLALSPDGRTLVYAAQNEDGDPLLYRRSLDEFEASPIRGTEFGTGPFFSPDGEWVGFFAFTDGLLKKVSLAGGPPTTLTPVTLHRWGHWGPDGTIAVAHIGEDPGVAIVSDAGGELRLIAPLPDDVQGFHAPHFLPDGSALLFTSFSSDRAPQIVVHDLETNEQKFLVEGTSARMTPTGHLLFTRDDSVWAVPFDVARRELTGEPAPVLEGVQQTGFGVARLALGRDGSLAYAPGAGPADLSTVLVRVDRDGTSTRVTEISGDARYPRFSPDGTQLAFAIANGSNSASDADVWVLDIARGARTRLTFENNNRFYPTWSPDGTQIAYANGAGAANRVMVTNADGSSEAEVLLDRSERQFPMSWAPDGSAIAMYRDAGADGRDIEVLPLDSDGTPVPFLSTPFQDRGVSFSPNGRWLAYVSGESGQDEVYVRPYPGPGGEVIVSNGGGQEAVWGPDGTELFYRNGNQMMVVAVETEGTFVAQATRSLFEGSFVLDNAAGGGGNANYDIAPDGQSFMMVLDERAVGAEVATPIRIVLNWVQELQDRVPFE